MFDIEIFPDEGITIERSYSGIECPKCGRKLEYKKGKENKDGKV